MRGRITVAPTITKLPEGAAGAVLITGSHGGAYPASLAAKARVRALIFHDAGMGREDAGVAALGLAIPAVAISDRPALPAPRRAAP